MSTKLNPFLKFATCIFLMMGLNITAFGQVVYQNVKSLKSLVETPQPARPVSSLIEGDDGSLYGTTLSGGLGGGTVFTMKKDGSGLKVLKSFNNPTSDGRLSYAGLVKGTGGVLYGMCYIGGSNNLGTVFKIHQDGSGFAVMHHFGGGSDGGNPYGTLIHGSNGVLFGTTFIGGISNLGTVFRINQDGADYAVLHHFTGANGEGANPSAGLTLGTNGVLYGTTESGGDFFSGTLFKVNQDGSGYEMLKKFYRTDGGGWRPGSSLVQGVDGRMYGITMQGSTNSYLVVFGINLDGSGFEVVKSFTDNAVPPNPFPVDGGLMQGTNGVLYGAVSKFGTNTAGMVFRVNFDGTGFGVLKSFNVSDGNLPEAAVYQGSDGLFYGTTRAGGASGEGVIFHIAGDGADFAIVKNFSSGNGDAQVPLAPVLLASDGWLYGTTQYGGSANKGAIFKVNRDGNSYELLKSFTGASGDGTTPIAPLVEGASGTLYGTTAGGGAANCGCVFKIQKDGTGFAVLKSFLGGSDGSLTYPYAPGLVIGGDGALYGSAYLGGTSNKGVVYSLDQSGSNYTILKNFTGNGDGVNPCSALMVGQDGALYGATATTLFKIRTDGTGFTVLKNNNVVNCLSSLVQDTNGVIYGAMNGFTIFTAGSAFRMNPDGSGYTVLKIFPPWSSDDLNPALEGHNPNGLTIGQDGTLYGTCFKGGSNNFGTIFKLRPDGSGFSVLKTFTTLNGDGKAPKAGLVMSNDGTLYGTTQGGGETGYGSIFSVAPAVAISKPAPINGKLHLSMTTGISGRIYTVQRGSSPAGPWAAIGTVTADTSGLIQYQDPNPPEGIAFYRTVYP